MGKIKKLQDKGATILPLTVADAVLMNSTEAGNLSTYLEALKSGVDFLLSIIGEDQAGDIFLKTKDGMPRGFYTEGFVSAGGKSTTEGGGGTGGATLSQMWESLQGNNDTFKDRLINVAHIPTLTTGKISDFVSATQAIADNAVANKADKDKVVDLTSTQTITGEKTFSELKVSNTNLVTNLNADRLDGLHKDEFQQAVYTYFPTTYSIANTTTLANIISPNLTSDSDSFKFYDTKFFGTASSTSNRAQIAYGYGYDNIHFRRYYNGAWTAWKEVAFKETTLSGYGITDAVKIVKKSANVSESCVGYTTADHNLRNGGLFTGLGADGLYGSQLLGNYVGTGLYYRGKNNGTWTAWKTVAFTDQFENYLPLTGGTLTGALTVNAPINNTGALKLLGASEVSSTGMAVGSGAKALGSNSRSLSEYSHAGLRTGNSNYPSAIISPYDLLPFTVNGETVYGTPIKANSSLTYKYNGISYTVENTTNYTQVLVLISVGSDFVAGVTHPLNKCALTYSKGFSLGRGQKIHAISELSDTVRAITIYTWVTGSTEETNFINNFVISNSNKFYTYKGVSLSTQNGSSSVASGASSVASGSSSVASGYASVASGYDSVASGSYSVASGSYSVASGYASVASGYASVASHESSKVFATSGISGRTHQTVLGHYNAEDTTSALVVGWGSSDTARKNIFTIDTNGYVRMGNRLHIGVGGQNELYLHSDVADQLYVHTSAGIPFLIQRDYIRRGVDAPKTTLGTDQYKWFNVFTESLKIADANLAYDTGTLTVDKALKTTSTLTATQGEFANYIKIGNATISWNARGGYLEINEGLASQKFISAGGVVTGNAGGGSGGLSLADMWISLNGNIDAYGKSKIHIDHIPLDAILSHDDYENDVADRINTFNYRNSSSFTSAVKALIVADNIPTLEMSKINGLEDTLTDIGTVVQSNYETLNTLITNNHKDHEARIKAIEQALTWQTV